MALNLLDSLSTTAAAPEKNSLALKTKENSDGATVDFGQMLGGIMNPALLKGLTNTDGSTDPTGDKATEAGQKVATADSDSITPDAAAAMMAMVAPAPQNLTALVLSPNMTAITPSQASPDVGSLVAFAKSQGLDEDVAAWLVAANKGAAGTTGAANGTAETATAEAVPPDAAALAGAAVAIGLLASPGQASAKTLTAANPEASTAPPIQLMPMTTPAAWLTQRTAASGKTANTSPALPQTGSSKDAVHSSDLDLTLVFGGGKDAIKTAPAPDTSFTPAAWVMAGVSGNAGQASSVLTDASLVRTLSSESQSDEDGPRVDGLGGVSAERSPGKLSDPLSGTSSAKPAESSLSTAERGELHQAQAEKMGQAIGQRMLSEMEKGHWHLKMMLKPANLGNIEVEMRLRNGELDANFTASQAVTRDLLQEGLPKLKDTLTQMGMDVANMNIGGGSSQKNGGDPTPQQTPTMTATAKMEAPEETTIVQSAQVTPSGQDGLDVLV